MMPRPETLFSAQLVHEDGSVLLALSGELDIATVPILCRAVEAVLSPHLRAVTLDIADLRFVDVAGLRGLLQVKERAEAVDAVFRLRSVRDLARRTIRLAGFIELEESAPSGSTDSGSTASVSEDSGSGTSALRDRA